MLLLSRFPIRGQLPERSDTLTRWRPCHGLREVEEAEEVVAVVTGSLHSTYGFEPLLKYRILCYLVLSMGRRYCLLTVLNRVALMLHRLILASSNSAVH